MSCGGAGELCLGGWAVVRDRRAGWTTRQTDGRAVRHPVSIGARVPVSSAAELQPGAATRAGVYRGTASWRPTPPCWCCSRRCAPIVSSLARRANLLCSVPGAGANGAPKLRRRPVRRCADSRAASTGRPRRLTRITAELLPRMSTSAGTSGCRRTLRTPTEEVGIVPGRFDLLAPSVRLTRLVLLIFFRSPPDADASSREMQRGWPRSGATEGCWAPASRGGPGAEPWGG